MYPKAGHQRRILVWSVLASVLFHAALVVVAHQLSASTHSKPVKGSSRLLAMIKPGQHGARWSAYNALSPVLETGTVPTDPRDNRAEDGASTPIPLEDQFEQRHDEPNEIGNAEDVYLPRELLSTAATPLDEIELQDLQSPVRGTFRMHVWISRYGKVIQIDIEATTTPAWLVAQIAERFRQSDFVPATRDDLAVASILDIEVSY